MKTKKETRGGKREGAGRKKEKVRMPSPLVKPATAVKIRALMAEKTFGELLDERF